MVNKEIYIPSEISEREALSRTTHLAIAAHQDDIEIMAYSGILECFGKLDKWFTGVVVTNGSGSPRSGFYEKYSDEEMMKIRACEQKKAAYIGEYSAQIMLDFPSSYVKNPIENQVKDEIKEIIEASKPQIIYTHNLADKHETHIGIAIKTIEALRECMHKPQKLYGCEVWRGLDWMNDCEKVRFNVEGHPNLENALLSVFDSQIAGGKRYDLATIGRRLANATYAESHGVDDTTSLIYAMDLTPLIIDKNLNIVEYVQNYIENFKNSVVDNLKKVIG